MLVERRDWRRILKGNPFPEAVDRPTTLHVFILAKKPEQAAIDALLARAASGERLLVRDKVLYLHLPDNFSTSKLPPVIDRILGTVSTARNWRTMEALGKMAEALG
jgi:uncharacterized protein (DUF1697 family)